MTPAGRYGPVGLAVAHAKKYAMVWFRWVSAIYLKKLVDNGIKKKYIQGFK